MHPLARLDRQFLWHPFTQMRDWARREPIVIASGKGAVLRDVHGREYLDANASIWTNLHGHRHARLDAALRRQSRQIAHSSALGLANAPAAELAAALVHAANPRGLRVLSGAGGRIAHGSSRHPFAPLGKVFFSDDGSTAIEVALKLAYEFTRRTRRRAMPRPRFLALDGAYHGDTVGAVSLGHIDLFHRAYAGLLFKSDRVMAPYCYRCPFNRARPERADARLHRRCRWECLGLVERRFAAQKRRGNPYAGFVFEPLIQGAAGMIAQPAGWLRQAADIASQFGALLIADEVMTGFGRTGTDTDAGPFAGRLFACHAEGVQPDFLALAKGLTGGYLPMAATLTTQAVFDAFLGEYEEFKTFFHGHSYTGNQLASAVALASLGLLTEPRRVSSRAALERTFGAALDRLWELSHVGDVRRVGLVAGVELVRDWRTRAAYDLRERVGIRVCESMMRRGVLTRPIGNVLVLMPPYCCTAGQVERMVAAMADATAEVCGEA